jgi:hypothetical protein
MKTLGVGNFFIGFGGRGVFGFFSAAIFRSMLRTCCFYSRATLGDRDARSLWWAGLLCGFLFENSLGAANGARGFDLWLGRGLWFGCRDSLFGRRDLSKNTLTFFFELKEWVVQDVVICGQTFDAPLGRRRLCKTTSDSFFRYLGGNKSSYKLPDQSIFCDTVNDTENVVCVIHVV